MLLMRMLCRSSEQLLESNKQRKHNTSGRIATATTTKETTGQQRSCTMHLCNKNNQGQRWLALNLKDTELSRLRAARILSARIVELNLRQVSDHDAPEVSVDTYASRQQRTIDGMTRHTRSLALTRMYSYRKTGCTIVLCNG